MTPQEPHAREAGTEDGLERLDPRFVPYDRTRRWIRVGVEAGILAMGTSLLYAIPWLPLAWVGVLAGAAALGIGLEATMAVVAPGLWYERARHRVDARGLEIREGIWWRTVVAVPRSRIQHLDVTQGPLERRFDLARLVVHTAGTHDASVELAGIAHPVALALRDDLGRWAETPDGV